LASGVVGAAARGYSRPGAGSLVVYALALCIRRSVAVVSFYSLVSAAQG
jgi:hypothetical protein